MKHNQLIAEPRDPLVLKFRAHYQPGYVTVRQHGFAYTEWPTLREVSPRYKVMKGPR